MAGSSTGNELINDAYLLAGIGDQYNANDAATQALGLRLLNDLLDSWSGEPLLVYQTVQGQVTLTVGVNTVSVPSGTVTVRPAEIFDVSVVDSSGFVYPVAIIGYDEWSSLVYPAATGRPDRVYFDYNAPTMLSYWYPTPSFAGDVGRMWYPAALTQFTALTQTLVMPLGAALAIKTGLATLLCMASGREPSATLQRAAWRYRRVLGLGHNQPTTLPMPAALRGAGRYNIYTDENT